MKIKMMKMKGGIETLTWMSMIGGTASIYVNLFLVMLLMPKC